MHRAQNWGLGTGWLVTLHLWSSEAFTATQKVWFAAMTTQGKHGPILGLETYFNISYVENFY